jgi:transcriptional regulator GlxA family with amidase domain
MAPREAPDGSAALHLSLVALPDAVDEISWRVGYEDPAFFRGLFKRTTGMAPDAYRKRFRIPDFARP